MKGKIKTLDKNNEKLKLGKIAKRQKLQEQGITLIALVVTIIILLILAGVTLNIALSNNGLFSKTKEATEKYEQAQKDEEKAIEDIVNEMEKITINYNDYVGSYVIGYTHNIKTSDNPCKITSELSGYESEQTFTTDETMQWRIWDYDESKKIIRLISEKPTGGLYLKNSTGYNNGVYVLNEICRQCYGTDERGVDVENIKRSDIEKIITYDYTEYVNDYGYKYGQKVQKTGNSPIMWQKFDQKWKYEIDDEGYVTNNTDKEGLIWEEENHSVDFSEKLGNSGEYTYKQSFWIKNINDIDLKNQKYYELLFGSSFDNYWLGTRYSHIADEDKKVGFGIQTIGSFKGRHSVSGIFLYYDFWGEQTR